MRQLPPLSAEQQEGFDQIKAFLNAEDFGEKAYFTLQGLAGSGKTTLLSYVAREFPGAWVCTLTGKAADVLRRKTGMSTGTIHSTFYKLASEHDNGEGKSILGFEALHRSDALWGQIVLLDECSMIDTKMAADILRTGVRVIACGDPGQLPPVNGEQFFQRPDYTLKTIHRQALDSPIIRQAHWVRLGRGYGPDTDAFRVLPKVTQDDVLSADVILCWRNKTRQGANAIVRRYRGHTAPHPTAGELVVCLKNSAEHGVWNGATYTLTRDFRDGDCNIWVDVNGHETRIEKVKFEGMRDALPTYEKAVTSFAYGYALTVHKSQGSEWPHVLLIDEYSRDDYRKEWVYTAVTRAAERCTVIRS